MDTPGGTAGTVLMVEFTLGGDPFFALNTPGFSFTEAVSFLIACGWLKDRWGVFWQVTPTRLMELIKDPDTNRARRAMEAMVKMIKIDIAEVERAADGA